MSMLRELIGPEGPPLRQVVESCPELGELIDGSTMRALDQYLDTPDERLRAAGLSARQRSEPGRAGLRVEAVALDPAIVGPDGALEAELADGRDALALLRDLLEDRLVLPDSGLQCMATLDVEHEHGRLRGPEHVAELWLDHVRARRPGVAGHVDFVSLRARHLEGSAVAFEAAVQQLARRLSAEPSTDRSYPYVRRMLGMPAFFVDEAEPVLDRRDRVATAARRLTGALLRQMRRHERGARVGLDPEQVHKMRVATRRLRGALQVLGPAFSTPTRRRLRAELRWLARALGRVRDLDVHRMALPRWRREHGGLAIAEPGWQVLEDQLRARWHVAHRELRHALDSERYRRLCAAAEAAFGADEDGGKRGRKRLGPSLWPLLRRSIRSFGRAHERFRRTLTMEDAHRLRIEAKGLRYAFELLSPLFGRGTERRVRRLVVFQDALGQLQDAAVARALVEQLLETAEPDLAYAFVLGQLHGASAATLEGGPEVVRAAIEGLRADEALAHLRRVAVRAARR